MTSHTCWFHSINLTLIRKSKNIFLNGTLKIFTSWNTFFCSKITNPIDQFSEIRCIKIIPSLEEADTFCRKNLFFCCRRIPFTTKKGFLLQDTNFFSKEKAKQKDIKWVYLSFNKKMLQVVCHNKFKARGRRLWTLAKSYPELFRVTVIFQSGRQKRHENDVIFSQKLPGRVQDVYPRKFFGFLFQTFCSQNLKKKKMLFFYHIWIGIQPFMRPEGKTRAKSTWKKKQI